MKMKYTPETQIKLINGIARGMLHLHSNNVIHRDLAARNILLSNRDPKISDFGMSRTVIDEFTEGKTKQNIGPLRWMSPESIKSSIYSTKSDVWMFGIVIYEIITRKEPHDEKNDIMEVAILIRDKGLTPTIPNDCNEILKEIMNQCWNIDPEKRPDFETICNMLEKV